MIAAHQQESRSRHLNGAMGEKFVKTLWTPARHKALYGGRGSAKSWSVATYLAIISGQECKKIVCGRQFQNSIRDSSKALIEKRLIQMGIRPQYHVTDQAIVHKGTKSEFSFVGLERNIESIRSLEGADIVWIDEARTIKAKSMEVLLPTVRNPGSGFIWTWNPEQPEDPVDNYFRGKQGAPPRSVVTFVDYNDNPFFFGTELPHEMEVLKAGNEARYRHVWGGEYDISYESKIFSKVTIGRVNVPVNCPPRYGMDFGFGSDPSFIVKVYELDDHNITYIAAEAMGRVGLDDLPALLRSVVNEQTDPVKADSSQPGTIEFLNRRGFNVVGAVKGPGSVKTGINYLQGRRIIIDPDCEHMREEARLYSWMTDRVTGKVLQPSVPVDADNHGWDATRYAVEDNILNTPTDDDDSGVIKLKFWK